MILAIADLVYCSDLTTIDLVFFFFQFDKQKIRLCCLNNSNLMIYDFVFTCLQTCCTDVVLLDDLVLSDINNNKKYLSSTLVLFYCFLD